MKIAVASGKGGTGKTTVSVNLASFLSEKEEVVLADLDVEEPNAGLFIGGKLVHREEKFKMIPRWEEERCTFCGICQEVCNFHAVIQLGQVVKIFSQLCHGCYACSELCPANALPMKARKMGELRYFRNGHLSFVESRLLVGEEQATPLITQANRFIDQNFSAKRMIIYDAPPGTSCPVIEVTRHADYVMLVTEPTPFGLHDLKLAVDTRRQLGKPFGVVVNRFGIGNNDAMDYCTDQGIPLLARIPNDRRIAELYARGKLIYREIPGVKEQLEQIWDSIKTSLNR